MVGTPESLARAYLVAVSLFALGTLFLTPWDELQLDAIYIALVAAMAVGELLTVQLRPNAPTATLLVVPAIVAFGRLGASALPGLAVAVAVVSVYRGVQGAALASALAREVLSFGVAAAVAHQLTTDSTIRAVSFALTFILVRAGLWHIARVVHAPTDERTRPDAFLCLLLAPLAALPLILGAQLADGGLLVVTAGVLAVMFVSREATNLSIARAEAEAERERLAQANALQEDLFHLISHDLKTPLSSVISYAQLGQRVLERGGDHERLAAYLDGIESAGQSMRRLVENLLQISSLERGESLPDPIPLNLVELAKEVAREYEPLAAQKQLSLQIEVDPATPPALAHPPLLREALSNLVGNAIKYTPEHGSVTVWTAARLPARIELGVTDTGIGISAEDQQRLFTKFYRSSDPRARAQRGSGLGLSLTRSVIERMGGTIEVESELDRGTTFRVSLPIAPSRDSDLA